MATPINKVTGIGPVSAKALQAQGIHTVEVLLERGGSALEGIRGFSEARVAKVMEAARLLIADEEAAPVSTKESRLRKPLSPKLSELTAKKSSQGKKKKKDKKKKKRNKKKEDNKKLKKADKKKTKSDKNKKKNGKKKKK